MPGVVVGGTGDAVHHLDRELTRHFLGARRCGPGAPGVPAQFHPHAQRPHRQMRLLRHPLRALLLLLVLSARGASACDTSGSVIDCRNADLTAVTFEPKKYDSVTFTEDASAVMTVPAKFADEVQAAVFQFACAGECKSLVLQGKQFYKVAHERASISITSAGDITFEDDAFQHFSTTGDVVVSAAGSLKFDGGADGCIAEHSGSCGAFNRLAHELRGEPVKGCASSTTDPDSGERICNAWSPADGKIIGEIDDGPMVYSGDILLSSGGDMTFADDAFLYTADGDFGTRFLGNIELSVGGNLKSDRMFSFLGNSMGSWRQDRERDAIGRAAQLAKYTYKAAHIGDIKLRVLGDFEASNDVFSYVANPRETAFQGTVTIDVHGSMTADAFVKDVPNSGLLVAANIDVTVGRDLIVNRFLDSIGEDKDEPFIGTINVHVKGDLRGPEQGVHPWCTPSGNYRLCDGQVLSSDYMKCGFASVSQEGRIAQRCTWVK